MSLALNSLQSSVHALRTPFTRPASVWLALTSAFLPRSFQSVLPSWHSLSLEWFPPFLLAVPKKKTSHSRKAMRSANKGLKDKTNIVNCPGCGSPKLAHHLCPDCFSQISRGNKREARERGQRSGGGDIIEVD